MKPVTGALNTTSNSCFFVWFGFRRYFSNGRVATTKAPGSPGEENDAVNPPEVRDSGVAVLSARPLKLKLIEAA